MSTYIYPYKEAILRYIRRNNRYNGLLGALKLKLDGVLLSEIVVRADS